MPGFRVGGIIPVMIFRPVAAALACATAPREALNKVG
jgi:hypothetical protein